MEKDAARLSRDGKNDSEAKKQYKIRGTKVVSPYPPELTPGETRLVFALQKFFQPEMILADYYLPKQDQETGRNRERVVSTADLVQIDCLALDRRGIFVFESKDYLGWIYAHGERVHWTQVSAYGKNKHQFYNPIQQNEAHIAALRGVSGVDVPIYSVVVFGREATLRIRENIPENCWVLTQRDLYNWAGAVALEEKLTEAEVRSLRARLEVGRVNPTTLTREEHVAEVQDLAMRGERNALSKGWI